MSNIFTFSATEVGYNHTKINKICEDASGCYDDDKMHICVVADGHGSDNYPRTDRGSKLAVNSAIKCIKEFVSAADSEDVLSDEECGFPILLQLAKSILMDWHESVEKDYNANPFSETELANVSEKYKMKYRSEKDEERNVKKAYGCTLVLYVVTERYSFGMQIGDGKCVVVPNDGSFTEPIPWDENCQLNVTTSICDSDAIDEFRFCVTDKAPVAVFCGSDGIDDSYANTEELYALYRSILKIFIEHGPDVGKSEIREYLPVLTKKGSGDDVSIGLILDISRATQLASVFDIQTELFTLNEKLKEKKQRFNGIVEKENALSVRIRKWLDSGKQSQDSGLEDVVRVNELRGSKEALEKEIKEIEQSISELNDSQFDSVDLSGSTKSTIISERDQAIAIDIGKENELIEQEIERETMDRTDDSYHKENYEVNDGASDKMMQVVDEGTTVANDSVMIENGLEAEN